MLYLPIAYMRGYIRMNLREIGWEGVDWIFLAQEGDQ
jgi:hypothetical protein